jgi:hypothetical protein
MYGNNPQFRDESIKPCELEEVSFFRYRKPPAYKLTEFIQFKLSDGSMVYLHDSVSKNQLISRINLHISDMRHIDDYAERNRIIRDAMKGREEPIILRMVKSGEDKWHCYAVVTPAFTEVRHSEVWRIVEEGLQIAGIHVIRTEDFQTPRRVWKTYIFEEQAVKKLGDVVRAGIRVCNSVKATSSICIYAFWERLVCSNGMTASKGHWHPATTHKGEKENIIESVRLTLKDAIDEAFGIEKLIEQAIQVKLSDVEAVRLLKFVAYRKNLSQRATKLISQRLSIDKGNLWQFINSITYIASHNGDKMSQPVILSLEQTAHGLLREKEDAIRRMIADADKKELAVQEAVS